MKNLIKICMLQEMCSFVITDLKNSGNGYEKV